MRHEAGFGAEKTAALRRPEAELEHFRRHRPEQQVEQVGGVTAHQRAGEAEHFFRFAAEDGHRLPLGGAGDLILVRLVNQRQRK